MYGYIYKTTNLLNNKIYIGQKKSHKFLENKYLGSGKHLKEAIKKYGADNFCVEMIDTAEDADELDEKEIHYICLYKSSDSNIGYNISLGGSTPRGLIAWNKGLTKDSDDRLIQSQTTRDKRSESLKRAYAEGRHNVNFSDDVRKKMSDKAKQRKAPNTKNYVWINNGSTQRTVPIDMLDSFISNGWVKGRTTKIVAWNKGLTKDTDIRVKLNTEHMTRTSRENRRFYAENNPKFKDDETLMKEIINNGFKEMLLSKGKSHTCKYFHIDGYGRVFERCVFLSGLSQ